LDAFLVEFGSISNANQQYLLDKLKKQLDTLQEDESDLSSTGS
jgi:hypothetical protein